MALSVWEALVLGIVQGATEWLPVSSTGHLTIAQDLFGTDVPVAFDLLLHLATLLAVLWVYRLRLWAMTAAVARRDWGSADGKMALLLVLGTVPVAIAGLAFQARIEATFSSTRVVGACLLWTALVLASTWRRHGTRPATDMRPRDAWWVGAWQALALLPGVSRSGMTIAAGMHAGLDRRAAADFAFLLAVPTLLAAAVLKAPDAQGLVELGWGPLVVGFVAATVSGWGTLNLFRAWVDRLGLMPFAVYCAALGAWILLA